MKPVFLEHFPLSRAHCGGQVGLLVLTFERATVLGKVDMVAAKVPWPSCSGILKNLLLQVGVNGRITVELTAFCIALWPAFAPLRSAGP